ncbi:MAG: AbrB/MazE/SpoVT family DNA-binding domain-containing protein, partial [Chthoniobacterales bacterium]
MKLVLALENSLVILKKIITTLTGKNQTTLPAALVGQAELEAGSRLEWTYVSPEEIRVRPLPPLSKVVAL